MYQQIYLVDDEELTNTINSIHFRKLGLEDRVRSFVNPELALDDIRFRKNQDVKTLILLDINMPEMTGFEFLEFMELESFPDSCDVLMVTSSENPEDKKRAEQYSQYVQRFITKPLRLEHLEDFLQDSNNLHSQLKNAAI